jgi:hypothetical protein
MSPAIPLLGIHFAEKFANILKVMQRNLHQSIVYKEKCNKDPSMGND